MLFVWVFALSAGMVNACALGGAGEGVADLAPAPSPAHQHDAAAEEHGHHVHAGHPAAPGPQDHEGACQKFCDDERSALSLLAKDLGSPGSMLPLLVQCSSLAWTSADMWMAEEPITRVPPRKTGPPIPIRLLRLTI
ncbi:MAG TPA: hypothetical protein VGE56_04860 [Rhodocyclaceae bacterium]